jgi:hypothetical protein
MNYKRTTLNRVLCYYRERLECGLHHSATDRYMSRGYCLRLLCVFSLSHFVSMFIHSLVVETG